MIRTAFVLADSRMGPMLPLVSNANRTSARAGLGIRGLAALTAGAVGVVTVVAPQDLALVGDVSQQEVDEVQGLEVMGAGSGAGSIVGAVGDRAGLGIVLEPAQRERAASAVAGQPLVGRPVVLVEPDGVVDAEAGVMPGQHGIGRLRIEELALDEETQQRPAHPAGA